MKPKRNSVAPNSMVKININSETQPSWYVTPRSCWLLTFAGLAIAVLAGIIATFFILVEYHHHHPTTTTTDTTQTTTTTTTRTTTTTTSSTTTSTTSTVTSTSTTTSSSTTTSTTTTTTTTTKFDSCSFLKWNQTGVNIAGTGSPTAGGSATSNTFKNPSWLYVDTNGTLYVSDFDNNRIQMWKNGSTNGITVAGSSTGTEGTTSSLLKRPFAVTFDNNGFMYVSEKENNRVQQFAPNSLVGTTVAGQANGQEGTTSSYLKKPTGIGVDKDQNVYIIDTVNQRLVVWPPNATSGNVLVSHNSLGDGYGLGLVPNTTNQIYYSTQGGTKSIYLWTFNATAPTITLNQVQDSANSVLKNPGNIVFDPYGNLYVPDKEPDRVVMFCTNATVGTVVIQGTDATLKNPSSISFDSNLNMYVAMGDGSYIVRYARLN